MAGGFIFLFIVLTLLKMVAFDLSSIPSGSMSPNLNPGHYVFVDKTAYWFGAPQRGDIVTFRCKDNTVWVKRLIGVPGDIVQLQHSELYLNGKRQERTQIEDFEIEGRGAPQYRETLESGRSFRVVDYVPNGFYDNTPEYRVPENSYFMMGDNRDNSTDSRVTSVMGYIAESDIIGRVSFIYFDENTEEPEFTPVKLTFTR
jgi:signal peptidase I